jgi:hypothetical protein
VRAAIASEKRRGLLGMDLDPKKLAGKQHHQDTKEWQEIDGSTSRQLSQKA